MEEIKKLADEGDPGAKWLQAKVERAEIAHALWMLGQEGMGPNSEAIKDIAKALSCYMLEKGKEGGEVYNNIDKEPPLLQVLLGALSSIARNVKNLVLG